MKLFVVLAFCLTLALVGAAPLLNLNSKHVVPDQYLVVFHKNSTVAIRDLHVRELKTRLAGSEKIINTFDIGSIIGYSAVLSKANLAQELAHDNVRYVEADQKVTLVAEVEDSAITQSNPTWGLDRIDQHKLPLDNKYNYFESAGAGVTAYVVDTGILTTHNEFGNRATWGYDATGEGEFDGNGHGTHVAGTVGGATYGVAKKVSLVAVKVLESDGSGTWIGVVGGIDWVTKDHSSKKNPKSVANMSLGGGASPTLDAAVEEAIIAGITFVVAAGNEEDNACSYSPARVGTAITVGATDETDTRAYFSNYGACVDVFAPGVDITAAWPSSNTALNTISGTSMASPHVAGIVAVYFAHTAVMGGDTPTPIDVDAWIKLTGTPDVIADAQSGSPNLLVYSPFSDVE